VTGHEDEPREDEAMTEPEPPQPSGAGQITVAMGSDAQPFPVITSLEGNWR
jgi:hypothetical protein